MGSVIHHGHWKSGRMHTTERRATGRLAPQEQQPHRAPHTTPQPHSPQSPYSPRNAVHGQLVHTTPQDGLERLTQSTAPYTVAYIGRSTEHREGHRAQHRAHSATRYRSAQHSTKRTTQRITPPQHIGPQHRESHHTTENHSRAKENAPAAKAARASKE